MDAGDKVVILSQQNAPPLLYGSNKFANSTNFEGQSISSNDSCNFDKYQTNFNSSRVTEEVVSVVYFGHDRTKKSSLSNSSKPSIVGIMAVFSGESLRDLVISVFVLDIFLNARLHPQ